MLLLSIETHPGVMDALPGAVEAHPEAVEAHPGAVLTLELLRFTLKHWRLTLKPLRLTLDCGGSPKSPLVDVRRHFFKGLRSTNEYISDGKFDLY
jgi:hypothetical protein